MVGVNLEEGGRVVHDSMGPVFPALLETFTVDRCGLESYFVIL